MKSHARRQFNRSKQDIKEEDQQDKKMKNLQFFAYHKVKFFKKDLQGKCDSLFYNMTL